MFAIKKTLPKPPHIKKKNAYQTTSDMAENGERTRAAAADLVGIP